MCSGVWVGASGGLPLPARAPALAGIDHAVVRLLVRVGR